MTHYADVGSIRTCWGTIQKEVAKMERWMTLQEVAGYLRVSKDSIYRLAQKGEVPASKIGNLWRFRKDEIDEWMNNNRKDKESK